MKGEEPSAETGKRGIDVTEGIRGFNMAGTIQWKRMILILAHMFCFGKRKIQMDGNRNRYRNRSMRCAIGKP